jgi:hypothetical protein
LHNDAAENADTRPNKNKNPRNIRRPVHKNPSRKRLCVVPHRNGKGRGRATASGNAEI